jgi:uncharacterized Tic20 family protein
VTPATDESATSDASAIETNKDARLYGMLSHLLALTGLLGNGVGFILGPLILWLLKREDHPFVDDQGRESVNFQITYLIVMLALGLLIIATCGFGAILSVPLMILATILDVVFVIIASLKANQGIPYRYPLCWRLIKAS